MFSAPRAARGRPNHPSAHISIRLPCGMLAEALLSREQGAKAVYGRTCEPQLHPNEK